LVAFLPILKLRFSKKVVNETSNVS